MSSKRNIAAIPLTDFQPVPIPTAQPEVTWIDPRELLVDEAYQRNLSGRSLALIRRIATGWDWRRFKAPSCSWTEDGLEVVDGQHTAIGAACRDDIRAIPVLITEAKAQAERAAAFIGLNRDRVGITPSQLHAAAVTAGDPDAVAVEQACAAAGITLLKSAPGSGRFQSGQTVAVAVIGSLVKRFGAEASRVLAVLAGANLAPIQANQIKAVELLLTAVEFGEPDPADITKAIVAGGAEAEKEAKLFAATHSVPVWRGLAAVWFKKMPKRRKPAIIFSAGIEAGAPPQPNPKIEPDRQPAQRTAVAALDDMKVDQRLPKGGWAPGRHIRRCSTCDCRFQGAISARECADCAYGGSSQ